MTTKSDSLYAGHLDMDDSGYGATAVNSRVFPNERLVTSFSKARDVARVLDRCVYDTFWLAERHFQREGYECIPNVLLLALDLAHQTERLKMGCGFNITPMWHPLRLAEDFAMVDVLTGGRVRFGVGRGYPTARCTRSEPPCSTRPPTASSSRSRSRSSSRRSTTPRSPTRGSATPFPPASRIAATI